MSAAIGQTIGGLDSDQDGSVSAKAFGLTNSSDASSAQQALFKSIDGDGNLSKTEVNSFQQQIQALFEKMQQMEGQQSSASDTMQALSSSA
ncbi:MAG TPA: hypothetical protein VFM48_08050 [Aquabacterium sp.]|nr:hypothetical protein [Aquabacterium sp.]